MPHAAAVLDAVEPWMWETPLWTGFADATVLPALKLYPGAVIPVTYLRRAPLPWFVPAEMLDRFALTPEP